MGTGRVTRLVDRHPALIARTRTSDTTPPSQQRAQQKFDRKSAGRGAGCPLSLSLSLVWKNMVLTWVVTPCSPAYGSTSMLFSSWVGNTAAAPTHVVTRQHETRMRVVERIGLQQQRQQSSAAAAFSAAPAPTGAATCHDDERGVPGEVVQAFPTSRGSVLRRVTSALAVGSIAFGIGASPGAALDPQRDARTALPPPPALLLPVMKVRVSEYRLR